MFVYRDKTFPSAPQANVHGPRHKKPQGMPIFGMPCGFVCKGRFFPKPVISEIQSIFSVVSRKNAIFPLTLGRAALSAASRFTFFKGETL